MRTNGICIVLTAAWTITLLFAMALALVITQAYFRDRHRIRSSTCVIDDCYVTGKTCYSTQCYGSSSQRQCHSVPYTCYELHINLTVVITGKDNHNGKPGTYTHQDSHTYNNEPQTCDEDRSQIKCYYKTNDLPGSLTIDQSDLYRSSLIGVIIMSIALGIVAPVTVVFTIVLAAGSMRDGFRSCMRKLRSFKEPITIPGRNTDHWS